MSKIYTAADQLIGHTPLLELTHIEKEQELPAHIIAKLEYFNPAGSVKDRIAKKMIDDAEEKGLLKEGSVIIEPTSGNTGIGLAAVAAATAARPMPVLPEVGSMMTEPGFSLPVASASSIMALAIRSLTEPAGLKYSSLARIFASRFSAFSIWVSSSSGVWPISWSAEV